jgi:uncharacterized membrane-anchored protein
VRAASGADRRIILRAPAATRWTVVLHSQPFYSYGSSFQADSIHVEYGIERYYVPEGTGLALEQARQEGEVSIAASVGADGTPQIKSLLVDGKPAYEEPLY